MDEAKTLLDIKERIESDDKQKTKLDGQKESKMKELLENYKCKTLASAKTLYDKREKILIGLRNKLNTKVKELGESYDWD